MCPTSFKEQLDNWQKSVQSLWEIWLFAFKNCPCDPTEGVLSD